MYKVRIKRFSPLSLLLLILLVAAGCTGRDKITPSAVPEGAYSIDPLFAEFYNHLGGVKVLGPGITPLFSVDNKSYQYTQASLIEYDPSAPPSQRYRLASLGLDMGIDESPVPAPETPDPLFVDGHYVYSDLLPLYKNLGGARFVGRPLTDVHYNPEKNHYEQYFENVGFYWTEPGNPEAVSLLAYGAWKCDSKCRHIPPMDAIVIIPSFSDTPAGDAFREVASRLGAEFSGFALSVPFKSADGKVEQIYGNIVLVADPSNPARVTLRPVPGMLGIAEQPPVPNSGIPGMYFYTVQEGLGYNVPQPFMDYITLHGSLEVSGSPIGELYMESSDVFRQCFANLCLDYHLKDPEALRIRPAPLGYTYKSMFYQPPDEQLTMDQFEEPQYLREVSLQAWESYPFVTSSQSQEISASIFENDQPAPEVEPIFTMTLPDGSNHSTYMPATGSDGQTILYLDPIEAPNGTLIPYKVCLLSLANEKFCVKDSFVVWDNP